MGDVLITDWKIQWNEKIHILLLHISRTNHEKKIHYGNKSARIASSRLPSTQGGRYPNSSTHQGKDASDRIQPRPFHHEPRNLFVLLLPLDDFLFGDVGGPLLALSRLDTLIPGLDIPLRAGLEAVVRGHHEAKSIRNDDQRHGCSGEVEPGGKLVGAAALRIGEVGKGEGGGGHDGGEDVFAHVKGMEPLVGDVRDGACLWLFGRRRGEEQRGDD